MIIKPLFAADDGFMPGSFVRSKSTVIVMSFQGATERRTQMLMQPKVRRPDVVHTNKRRSRIAASRKYTMVLVVVISNHYVPDDSNLCIRDSVDDGIDNILYGSRRYYCDDSDAFRSLKYGSTMCRWKGNILTSRWISNECPKHCWQP